MLPRWPEVVSLLPLGANEPPSWFHLPLSPYPLHTLRISAVMPPTVPRLPVFSLCRSSPTVFPPPLALLLPRTSTMSRLLFSVIDSLWSVWGILCVTLLLSSPLLSKGWTSPNHTVIFLVLPPCKIFPPPWGLPLPQLIVIKVLCFSTMYIISIDGGAQA